MVHGAFRYEFCRSTLAGFRWDKVICSPVVWKIDAEGALVFTRERRGGLRYRRIQLGHASSSVTLRVSTHLIPCEGAGPYSLDTHESANLAQKDTLTPREMEGLVYRG